MEKFLTYNKKELEHKMDFIKSKLNDIEFYLTLFQEQHEGKRTNMAFSEAEGMLVDLNEVYQQLADFGVNTYTEFKKSW